MTPPRAKMLRRSALPCTMAAAIALAGFVMPANAHAEDGSATVRLIQLLIQKGILTQEQAGSLLKEAQDEARAKARPGNKAAKPVPAETAAAAPAATEPPPAPTPPGTVRVTYVPQIVRDQIAAEVKQQVMQQAKAEAWASPNEAAPEWTKRIHIYGDVRFRNQYIMQNKNNGYVPNFNSINTSGGFDTSSGALPASINTNENRYSPLLRARLGVRADVNDWVSADVRFGTGNDSSPVSTNATLGGTGNFSKIALWLDRGYLTLKPFEYLKAYVGRSPNPFFTSDLLFYDELSFDGASLMAQYPVNGMLDVFANAGAYSVYNTALAFSTFNEPKFPSHDKFLFAGQAGVNVKPVETLTAKLAAGFFAFTNVQGQLSTPCTIIQSNIGCNTDATAAQFVQFGNTLFPVRNIATTATNTTTPQLYGLASGFNILDLHGQTTYSGFAQPVTFEAEFSKNLAFNRRSIIARGPVNNLTANSNEFHGGDTAYMGKITVGKLAIAEKWDWNVFAAYKYLESDAVMDAFNDPHFHLGGTNAKGYIVGANLGLGHNLTLSALWYSASQITGTPYSNDVVQVDLQARF